MTIPQLTLYSRRNTKTVSLDIRSKIGLSALTYLIQHSTTSPNHSSQKRTKGIQIKNGDVKLSLFADDIITYRENPKDSTPNYQN